MVPVPGGSPPRADAPRCTSASGSFSLGESPCGSPSRGHQFRPRTRAARLVPVQRPPRGGWHPTYPHVVMCEYTPLTSPAGFRSEYRPFLRRPRRPGKTLVQYAAVRAVQGQRVLLRTGPRGAWCPLPVAFRTGAGLGPFRLLPAKNGLPDRYLGGYPSQSQSQSQFTLSHTRTGRGAGRGTAGQPPPY